MARETETHALVFISTYFNFAIFFFCFRRDRGFCYKLVPLALESSLEHETYKEVCYGNVTLTYVGPSILHFLGFLYALYLFRISDNEQLQNLMERVRMNRFLFHFLLLIR